jgi:hypothetical protein
MTVRTTSWKNIIENRYHRLYDHSILMERYPDAHKVELRENVLITQQITREKSWRWVQQRSNIGYEAQVQVELQINAANMQKDNQIYHGSWRSISNYTHP